MTALRFPGQHHVLTRYQEQGLRAITAGEAWAMADVDGRAVTPAAAGGPGGVDVIVWAVTSANHSGTRRNPLPAHRREAAIEALAAGLGVPSLVYLVDDIGETERFAAYVLKK